MDLEIVVYPTNPDVCVDMLKRSSYGPQREDAPRFHSIPFL